MTCLSTTLSWLGYATLLAACGGHVDPSDTSDGGSDAIAAAPAIPGKDVALSISIGGVARTGVLHVPAGYEATQRYPLILVFHGRGGTGAGIERMTGFDAVSDEEGFLVAYPDAIGGKWQTTGPNNDIAFSEALVAALEKAYGIDSARVYVSGFSEGGGMSQALACSFTTSIAGAADVSENLSPRFKAACHPAAPITFLLFHGTADPVSPYDGGVGSIPGVGGKNTYSALETAQFWVDENGCASDPSVATLPDTLSDGSHVIDTLRSWSGCLHGTTVTFYAIEGGGHAWPGGMSNNTQVGPSSRGLDASRIIWKTLGSTRR